MGRARICRTQCSSQRPLFEFDSWVFIAVHRLLIAVTSFVEEPGFRSCGLLAQLLHNRHVEPPLLRDGIHVLCIGRYSLTYWVTREVPGASSLKRCFTKLLVLWEGPVLNSVLRELVENAGLGIKPLSPFSMSSPVILL